MQYGNRCYQMDTEDSIVGGIWNGCHNRRNKNCFGFRIRYVTSFRMESEAQKHGYCLFECLPDDILEVQDVLAQEKDIPDSVIREGEQNEVLFRGDRPQGQAPLLQWGVPNRGAGGDGKHPP